MKILAFVYESIFEGFSVSELWGSLEPIHTPEEGEKKETKPAENQVSLATSVPEKYKKNDLEKNFLSLAILYSALGNEKAKTSFYEKFYTKYLIPFQARGPFGNFNIGLIDLLVRNNNYQYEWVELQSRYRAHVLDFYASMADHQNHSFPWSATQEISDLIETLEYKDVTEKTRLISNVNELDAILKSHSPLPIDRKAQQEFSDSLILEMKHIFKPLLLNDILGDYTPLPSSLIIIIVEYFFAAVGTRIGTLVNAISLIGEGKGHEKIEKTSALECVTKIITNPRDGLLKPSLFVNCMRLAGIEKRKVQLFSHLEGLEHRDDSHFKIAPPPKNGKQFLSIFIGLHTLVAREQMTKITGVSLIK